MDVSGAGNQIKCNTFKRKAANSSRLNFWLEGSAIQYQQFTMRERYLIVKRKSMGLSLREIGNARCRSASTISRESRPRKSEHGLKWTGCSDGRG